MEDSIITYFYKEKHFTMRPFKTPVVIFLLFLFDFSLFAQPGIKTSDPIKYDLSKDPVLYTVGYAHLDTQWRWDYPETINQYIKATLDDNFRFFDKYDQYVFTFTGAHRYKMMKEYYPDNMKS